MISKYIAAVIHHHRMFSVVLLSTGLLLGMACRWPCSVQSKGPAPLKVAVLDFEETGAIADFPHGGKIVADWIIEGLVTERRFSVVERRYLEQVLREQNLQQTGIVQESSAVDIGRILGVAYLVSGTLTSVGGQVLVNVRVVDVETGTVVSASSVQASSPQNLRTRLLATAPFLIDGKPLNGTWEAWAEKPSTSKVSRSEAGGLIWEYDVPVINDSTYAIIDLPLASVSVVNRRLRFRFESRRGFPVYVVLYSFVEGYSTAGDEESLVPGIRYLEGKIGEQEVFFSLQELERPPWWKARPGSGQVPFNPQDVRMIEIGSEVDEEVGPVANRLTIHSISLH